MKCGIIVVYALYGIFVVECRLRDGDNKKDEDYETVEDREEDISDAGDGESVKAQDNQDKKESDKYRQAQENKQKDQQIEREIAAGSVADVLSPNQHYSMSNLFKDLGRRFVPQYPYYEKEKQEQEDKKAEDYLHKVIQDKMQRESEDKSLIPVKASPEFVVAVAKQSKVLEESKTINPTDELIKKESLRTGDYWNAVWKEDVQPLEANVLRTEHQKHQRKDKVVPLPKLGSVRTKIMPGTKLYQLISVLKQISPRFLYVMNVDQIN